MTKEEVESHIADYDRLRQLCAEQSAALKWARELLEQKGLANDQILPPAEGGSTEETK